MFFLGINEDIQLFLPCPTYKTATCSVTNLENNKNYFQGGKTAFVLLKRNSDETVEEINM